MNENITINADGVEQIALKNYTEQAYLNYSMYVINDRALPNIGDGLHYISSWADYNLLKSNFSFGLNFSREVESSSSLSSSTFSPSISYEVNLNYNWVLKSGIQVSLSNSNFNRKTTSVIRKFN